MLKQCTLKQRITAIYQIFKKKLSFRRQFGWFPRDKTEDLIYETTLRAH
ncbi:hypothetical protein NECAME_19080 [Necator americanus]|uniref:Uncharacterized protein n=1 Tax=Necator americanus TaxID=51031 RepID=W2SQR4_NECAM|nr:hypothetical protein NECAME_19080 [Necator americanus]ETN71970.1 hypothetical protein NECAME_19080 [Necator americanus]